MKIYIFISVLLKISTTLSGPDDAGVCTNPECVSYARFLLSNMNMSANPCDNFYQFACGNYANANPIPKNSNRIYSLSQVASSISQKMALLVEQPINPGEPKHFQMLKRFFSMCLDTDTLDHFGLHPIQQVLDQIGGWPVVTNRTVGNWENYLLFLMQCNGSPDMIFVIQPAFDMKLKNIKNVMISPPNFRKMNSFLSKGKIDPRSLHFDYMVELAVLFGADRNVAKIDMKNVLEFELQLIKFTMKPNEITQNLEALRNIYSIKQLLQEYPGFPWIPFLDAIGVKLNEFSENQKIQLSEPRYIRKLIEMLSTVDRRIIVNYFILKYVKKAIPHLSREAQELYVKYSSASLAVPTSRSDICIRLATDQYLPLISSLYVRNFFNLSVKEKVTDMVNRISIKLKKLVKRFHWCEDGICEVEQKIANMKAHIAYPPELLDDNELAAIYNKAPFIDGQFVNTLYRINKFNMLHEFGMLNKKEGSWTVTANSAVTNAYYYASFNFLTVPAGILEGPFYNEQRPTAINFAAIGSILGHEITHAFDGMGLQFDRDGYLIERRSTAAVTSFAKSERCIIDQYDQFKINDMKVDGNLTANENLADYAGLILAYITYKDIIESGYAEDLTLPGFERFTPSQLFWAAYAGVWCSHETADSLRNSFFDVHAPNMFRVIGPLQNIEAFSRDYNCPLESPMNPAKKCTRL